MTTTCINCDNCKEGFPSGLVCDIDMHDVKPSSTCEQFEKTLEVIADD